VGQKSPPLVTHAEFYFGFLVVALAWQFAFLVISKDPVKYRLIMVPGVVEKFGFAHAYLALYLRHALSARDASWATSSDPTSEGAARESSGRELESLRTRHLLSYERNKPVRVGVCSLSGPAAAGTVATAGSSASIRFRTM
jgi:hypothetical protein